MLGFGIVAGLGAGLSRRRRRLTVAFFTIGQAVQVLVADADRRTVLLFVALVSYGARVGCWALLIVLALANADRFRRWTPVRCS